MKVTRKDSVLFASALMIAGASSASAAIITDNFEVPSGANYTVVNSGAPDSSIDFSYDYIAAGIPLAPNSAGGDTLGLRMTANDTVGVADHQTAFHNTVISATPGYRLSVDIYMGVEGTGGTTEFATVGIGGDGSTFNSIFTPISGSGHFLSMTGDGGSSSDYRHFIPPGTPVNSGDPSYLNSTNTTNATGDTYQAIFPGGDFPGSPGNRWTTLTIEVLTGGSILYSLDGVGIIKTGQLDIDGQVSLAYNDVFGSVANPFQSMYVIYDNLDVSVPEPASLALLALGGVAMLRRRR
jgi:hypothetical protein